MTVTVLHCMVAKDQFVYSHGLDLSKKFCDIATIAMKEKKKFMFRNFRNKVFDHKCPFQTVSESRGVP